jgi:hypothetical protein
MEVQRDVLCKCEWMLKNRSESRQGEEGERRCCNE